MTPWLLLLLVLGGGAAAAARRRATRRVATAHRRALRTLDHITRDGVGGPGWSAAEHQQHVRLVGSDHPAASGRRPRPAAAVAATRGPRPAPGERPRTRPVVRFDAVEGAAAAPSTPPAAPEAAQAAGTAGSHPAGGDPLPQVGTSRPRPVRVVAAHPRAAAAAVAGVVLAGGVAAAATLHGGPAPRPAATEPARSAPPPTPAPTPTTVAAPPAGLVSSRPGAAAYQLAGPATITVRATGASWAELRAGGPAGAVLYEGTLQAGQTQSAQGPVWLRLGDPTAVVTAVNGTVVVAPDVARGVPYDLQFG